MLRTIVSIGFFQAIGILVNTLRSKLFALLLGPSGFGLVATIDQLVVSITQFSNLSVPFTALKFLSHSHSQDEASFKRTYAAFLRIILILSGAATVLALLIIPLVLDGLDSQLAAHRGTVIVALLSIPATMLQMFLVNVLAARQQSTQSVLLTVLFGLAILIGGGIGCWITGVDGIYLGAVPATSTLAVGTLFFLHIKGGLPFHSGAISVWSELKANARIMETAVCTYIAVCSSSGLLLFMRYGAITKLGAETAGLLQACLGVSLSIGAVLGPATSLYFTSYVNRALPPAEKVDVAGRFLPRLVFLFCLGALPVLLFPGLCLRILFSKQFVGVSTVLPWFVVWQCLYQISNVYQQLLIGLNDVRGYGLVTTVGNVISVICCAIMISSMGLVGISIGLVVGALITSLLTALRLRVRHQLPFPRAIFGFALLILAGFPTVAAVVQMKIELSVLGVALRSGVAVLFMAALWLLLPRALRTEMIATVAGKTRSLLGKAA